MQQENSAFWHKLPPVLRDYLELVISVVVELVWGAPAAYALHLGMKAVEVDFGKEARKPALIMGHAEFLAPWIFGEMADIAFSHPALGILVSAALHLAMKALTLYSAMKK